PKQVAPQRVQPDKPSQASKRKRQEGHPTVKPDVERKVNLEAGITSEQPKAQDSDAEAFLRASMETFGGKIISKPKEN
ncbi:MAG TPA: hypothetical protein DDZ66_05755, partial [Firmicutes bacterium]|nr:hypothetical protein [Bacillota bacterium]